MRLFLDQMFGADFASALIAAGHDVVRAADAGLARPEPQFRNRLVILSRTSARWISTRPPAG